MTTLHFNDQTIDKHSKKCDYLLAPNDGDAPSPRGSGMTEAVGCPVEASRNEENSRMLDVPTRRRRAPSASLATRYLRAAEAAGAAVSELIVEPDGRIRILLGAQAPAAVAPDDVLGAWLSKKGARS